MEKWNWLETPRCLISNGNPFRKLKKQSRQDLKIQQTPYSGSLHHSPANCAILVLYLLDHMGKNEIEACTYSSAQHGSVHCPRRAAPMLFMAAKARNNHLRLRLTWIRPPYRLCVSAALRGGKKSWSTYLGLYLTWISLPSQTCIKAALHHGKIPF